MLLLRSVRHRSIGLLMQGGLVGCVGADSTTSPWLERIVDDMRWHGGTAEEHHFGRFHFICLVDAQDGPFVEVNAGRTFVTHGAPASPAKVLQNGHSRFAALEWDGRVLRASRDTMGEVPLFYRRAHGALWVASEIHPLVALGGATPDLSALAAFAATVEYPERTGWQGIYRVLPAETLEVDEMLRLQTFRYWKPRPPRRLQQMRYETAVDRFRELFNVAVERRLAPKTGIMLGGLDSAAVAATAAQRGSPTLLTVSHPTLPQVDETVYAQAVADAAGLPLNIVEWGDGNWDPLDELKTFGVPPVKVPTDTLETALAGLQSLGCEVALDGHDGDGVLGNFYAECGNVVLDGRPWRLASLAREHGWPVTILETARDLIPSRLFAALLRRREMTAGDQFLPYFFGTTYARLAERYRWRSARRGWRQEQVRICLPPATLHFEEGEMLGARYGIDIRHPFSDRDLIEFLTALPHAIKASPARSKPVMRDALYDVLPTLVTERKGKANFSAVIDRRVDFQSCYEWVRDSAVRLPDIDYGRLLEDAKKPKNSRILWTRLAIAHVFVASGAA